jgi:hypothetical protein
MNGNSLKKQRIAHAIPRRQIAAAMEVSEARAQQIEQANRLTPRMSQRYASAIEAILRQRHVLTDSLAKGEMSLGRKHES